MKRKRLSALLATMSLKLDYCQRKVAEFACKNWHYSKCLPAGKILTIGVWEDDVFVGCVLFSRGANKSIASPYGLKQTECVELTRVALNKHKTPTSKIVAIALKILKKTNPGIKMVVSYADNGKGHHGGIYQAGNWIYNGVVDQKWLIDPQDGKIKHPRSLNSKYGSVKGFKYADVGVKYRYLYFFDKVLGSHYESMKYPKRVLSDASVTAGFQPAEGGATPTNTHM